MDQSDSKTGYDGLRSLLAQSEALGEVRTIKHADWNLEIGALTETVAKLIPESPALMFGQPIAKFQAVQFKLVDMLAQLEQARLYTYHAASLADRGQPITIEAALSKIIAADGCNQICQKALNIFGGYGLMSEFPVQRYLRDSYFPMIGGGTSDIMRLIVARQLGL